MRLILLFSVLMLSACAATTPPVTTQPRPPVPRPLPGAVPTPAPCPAFEQTMESVEQTLNTRAGT